VNKDLPKDKHNYSPNAILDNKHQITAAYQYRFGYRDIVSSPLEDHEQTWIFDTKLELEFYGGDTTGMKCACHVYQPYHHAIVTCGNVQRVPVSEVDPIVWYGKRVVARQQGLS